MAREGEVMWVCERCGGDDIQTMMWVGVNTNEVFEQCHSWDRAEANYCETCRTDDCNEGANATFVSKEEYEKAAEVQVETERHTTMEVSDG